MVKLNPKPALNQFDLHFHFLRILKWCASTSLRLCWSFCESIQLPFYSYIIGHWVPFFSKKCTQLDCL